MSQMKLVTLEHGLYVPSPQGLLLLVDPITQNLAELGPAVLRAEYAVLDSL